MKDRLYGDALMLVVRPAVFSPAGPALHQSTLSGLMHELNIDAVAHGFRSSFRDRAAECTDAPREVCELAFAQVNTHRVEAAYRHTDLFEKRRALMADCADYISPIA